MEETLFFVEVYVVVVVAGLVLEFVPVLVFVVLLVVVVLLALTGFGHV